jgi:hypothetical protein
LVVDLLFAIELLTYKLFNLVDCYIYY